MPSPPADLHRPTLAARWAAWPASRRLAALALLLTAVIVATYSAVGGHKFVNLDDDAYVEFQPMVNQGVRPAALAWAFGGAHSGQWHPLTTLTHILDCEIFGVNPGPMHWVNLGWHGLNAVLVLLVWHALTGAFWRSALVAALFALHPLGVESVAWISERKNLVSTCFWLSGILAYTRYVRAPAPARYFGVFVAMTLAIMSKPMVVTFPATLLLLDFWPLRRWPERTWRALVIEKLPLFGLSIALCVVTLVAQASVGAGNYGSRFPIDDRLGNALVSCVRYVGKLAWPHPLAPFYPHPGTWPWALVAASGLAVAAVTALAWFRRGAWPWLAFGWCWFLGTLVPVIGLVQVGAQAMADRYTYVTALGLFTIVAWGGGEVVRRWPRTRAILVGVAVLFLAISIFLTRRQAAAWSHSERLYTHVIADGEDNATLRYLLGVALGTSGRPIDDVAAQFKRALELKPDYVNAHAQLANLALHQQRIDLAEQHIRESLRLDPRRAAAAHKSLAAIKKIAGQMAESEQLYRRALELDPDFAEAHHEFAWLLIQQQRLPEARPHAERAARLQPWDVVSLRTLAIVKANVGLVADARRDLERALWINPQFAPARDTLAELDKVAAPKSPR